jgi:hypothetical protein
VLGEDGERALREMMDAHRVIEARVCCAGIHEVGVTELLDVPQPLERGTVYDTTRHGVDPYRVPQRVPDRDRLQL